MKILHLTLKKKWFDMILSGEKKEEYREIKSYWWIRLVQCGEFDLMKIIMTKDYDTIKFTNGYQKNAPWFLIECKGIDIGSAVPEWSDNWQWDVFRIKLGEIIDGNCLIDCNYGNNHIIPTDSRVKLVNE
jgi:hypothetical protein